MFGEDEATAREQQRRRTRGREPWVNFRQGQEKAAGCLGTGAEPVSTTELYVGSGLGLQGFTPASTQAQIPRAFLSLLETVEAAQAGKCARDSRYHSPQGTPGDHEELLMTYLNWSAGQTHKLHPAFLWAAI